FAVHVRLISYVHSVAEAGGFTESRMMTPSPNSTSTCGSHPSDAVTAAGGGTSLHSTVASAGTLLKVGAVVSTTLIVALAVVLLPHASFAVQVRVTEKASV